MLYYKQFQLEYKTEILSFDFILTFIHILVKFLTCGSELFIKHFYRQINKLMLQTAKAQSVKGQMASGKWHAECGIWQELSLNVRSVTFTYLLN